MKPTLLAIIGLIFDLLGAFFLSVEAIGVENLRNVLRKYLQPLQRGILGPLHQDENYTYSPFRLIITLVLVLLVYIFIPKELLPIWLFFSFTSVVYFSIELFNFLIILIEKRGPRGTIGMIGFLLLTIGFLLQIIANAYYL